MPREESIALDGFSAAVELFARSLGHEAVGSEHILLAICEAADDSGQEILSGLGTSWKQLNAAIHRHFGPPSKSNVIASPIWTLRASRILKNAAAHALRNRNGVLTPGAILLALADENGCGAMQILESMGITAPKLRLVAWHWMELSGTDLESAAERALAHAEAEKELTPVAPTVRSERLSGPAQRVVELAETIAIGFSQLCIGAEHLLIALGYGPESVAQSVLASLGVSSSHVVQAVTRVSRRPENATRSFRLPSRLLLNKIVDRAAKIADAAGAPCVDTGHLLLALLENGGAVLEVLGTLGVDMTIIQRRLMESPGGVPREPFAVAGQAAADQSDVNKLLGSLKQAPVAADRASAARGEAPPGAGKRCSHCLVSNAAVARFCAGCGQSFPAMPQMTPRNMSVDDWLRNGIMARARGPAWRTVALNCFHRARRLGRRDVTPLMEIARTYAAGQDYRRAMRWYRRAVRRDRRCFEAWREGARCLPEEAGFQKALWLGRGYRKCPDNLLLRNEYCDRLSRLPRWQQRFVRSLSNVLA